VGGDGEALWPKTVHNSHVVLHWALSDG